MRMTAEQVREHQAKHFPQPSPPIIPLEPTPAQSQWRRGEEKQLSQLVVADLRRRGFFVVVSRTDQPTSNQVGLPDIIACHAGRVAMVELKAAGGVLSAKQSDCHAELTAAGVPVCVAWNFDAAVKFVCQTLALP